MGKNIAAIIVIFLFTTFAWMTSPVARGAIPDRLSRTAATGDRTATVAAAAFVSHTCQSCAGNAEWTTTTKVVDETSIRSWPVEQSRIRVALDLEHGRRGLLRSHLSRDDGGAEDHPGEVVKRKMTMMAAMFFP